MMIGLPKMRRLSKIGVLVILGALLCIPGSNAHLGVIDTLSSSFTGPCIYDGAYGKANPLILISMLTFFTLMILLYLRSKTNMMKHS